MIDDFGGHDRPDPAAPEASRARGSSKVLWASRGSGMLSLIVTGIEELDKEIEAICAVEGPKSLNAAMRKFAREVVNEIVLPKVRELIPFDDGRGAWKDEGGHLEDQIVVRAVRRSKRRIGFSVGFPDKLFTGPTFYGGFIEFGWDHRGGFHVEADSYLRRALYPEAGRIYAAFRGKVAAYLAERNRAA